MLRSESSARAASSIRKFDLMLDGLDVNIDSAPSLSPDGERMLYRASGRLFVRALSEFAPKPLPGSEGANYFFWSPDGRQVAFVRDGKIWRVGVDSSEATQVGAVPRDFRVPEAACGLTEVSSSSLAVTASDSSPCR